MKTTELKKQPELLKHTLLAAQLGNPLENIKEVVKEKEPTPKQGIMVERFLILDLVSELSVYSPEGNFLKVPFSKMNLLGMCPVTNTEKRAKEYVADILRHQNREITYIPIKMEI